MNQPNQFNQLNTSQKPQPSFQPERPKRFSWPRWTSIFIAAVAVVVISLVSWAAYRAFISTPIELPSESPEEKQVSPLPAAGEITPADETAIWQTYRNEEYGFEVKYPNNWSYKIPTDHRIEFTEDGKVYTIEGDEYSPIGISVIANIENKTALDWANGRNKYKGEITTLDISQESAAKILDYLGIETYIIHNSQKYTLAMPNFGDEEINKTILEVYNQILSTFKFIK